VILRGIDFKKGRTTKGYNGSRDPFYQTKEWRDFRNNYMMMHPLCVMCERDGRTSIAYALDHIVPINKGGAIWSEANLQGLCLRHNAQKTALDNPLND